MEAHSLTTALARAAREIQILLERFAKEHGSLKDWATAHPEALTATPYRWDPLDLAGRRLQSRLLEEYRRYGALVSGVLQDQLPEVHNRFFYFRNNVDALIERKDTPFATVDEVLELVTTSLRGQLELVAELHSEHERLILVPDTNALYWNTKLETWKAPTEAPFLIALTPMVIEELDRHKADCGNEARQQKAARLIRQISEYRRRGRLVDGVPLAGNCQIFGIATSATPQDFFPWLRGGSMDDYFLAAAVSVMRRNPRAPTVIVTRDLNLQTKIEFAGFSYWTPAMVVKEGKPEKVRRTKSATRRQTGGTNGEGR